MMSAIPEGPAAAVAVTYCVPALEGASVGPLSEIVGVELSMLIVLVGASVTPAAFVASSVNFAWPSPSPCDA